MRTRHKNDLRYHLQLHWPAVWGVQNIEVSLPNTLVLSQSKRIRTRFLNDTWRNTERWYSIKKTS